MILQEEYDFDDRTSVNGYALRRRARVASKRILDRSLAQPFWKRSSARWQHSLTGQKP